MKIDPLLVQRCWYRNAEWRHPHIKFVLIIRLFTFQCDLRQQAISWRTFILRFPRRPFLHIEKES